MAVPSLVITEVGFKVTVRVNGVPAHPLIVGVIMYSTLTGFKEALVSVSVISPVPSPLAGVTSVTSARFHVNTGSGLVELVISYVFETALHQLAVGKLLTTDVGFTVTATSFTVPAHVFTVGVIR